MEKKDYILKKSENGEEVTVRNLQLALLPIMDEIHRICEKHKIPYCLIAGSALGICNYQGFIPWDDDMDVAIPREYWSKFVAALKEDLSDEFYFHCYDTDKKYNVLIPDMKIRKKGTYIAEVNFLLKNKCSGDGIYIDVITYDHVADNKKVDEAYRLVPRIIMPFIVLLDNMGINPNFLKKIVLKWSDHYSKKYKNSHSISQSIAIPWEKPMKEPIFDEKDIYPVKLYDFEGRKYYSYNNIKKVMTKWYGPNCLKKWNGHEWVETLPEEKRKPKHCCDLSLKTDKIGYQITVTGYIYACIIFIIALFLNKPWQFPTLILAFTVGLITFIKHMFQKKK